MEELLVISQLVRMSIFGTVEDIPIGINWSKVFADAAINGVSAICYEAVKRLPADRQPDFGLMVRWDLSSQEIREGFHRRHGVTQEFRETLADNGMEMVLLKGETLAANYPEPDLRESGDVDFLTLPNSEACNSLVRSLGIEVTYQGMHSSFEYMGIHFENHSLEHPKGYYRSHHRTLDLLRESLASTVRRDDGCLELDPVMQAVFVVKHISQHLCHSGGRVSLRMLLDLALLLRRHPEIQGQWEPKLRQAGLSRFAADCLSVSDRLLGTRFSADRSPRSLRRSGRFARYFLTDSNPYVRYIVKFGFLPLRPSEKLRFWAEKAVCLVRPS